MHELDEALLQEDVVDLMPAIENANSISEDLDKKMKFELMVVSPEARGELTGRTQVIVVRYLSYSGVVVGERGGGTTGVNASLHL